MSELRNKLILWEGWIFGDDVNSINNQVHKIIWDSAVFQSINETRKYAPSDDNGQIQLNGTVHEFINDCFFRTQAVAIRKLLDKRKDVISLAKVIDDIHNSRKLLTRQDILDAHGYPYDYEEHQKMLYKEKTKGQNIKGKDFINAAHSESVHKLMDSLSEVDSATRSHNDTIKRKVFKWLRAKLDKCKRTCDFVNHYIAHSTKPGNRPQFDSGEDTLTFGEILKAHKIICEVVSFISMNILNRSFANPLAVPQFSQFEHFDKPWATEETVKELYRFWKEYDKKTREWTSWEWTSERWRTEYDHFVG